jgi:ParB family chromosome partitioning protein
MNSQKGKRAALRSSILGLATDTEINGNQGHHARGIVGTALDMHRDALLDKVRKLETDLAEAIRSGDRLVELAPDLIDDPLPADRDKRAYADAAFAALRDSISNDGQHVPILVRSSPTNYERYEIAAGRRRLAVCRSLGRSVLARIVDIGDEGMLALQYRENALRRDISVLERGRWLRQLAEQRDLSTTRVATLVGLSQPMVVEYQKLARLPEALLDGFADPRELSLADGRRLQAALSQEGALDRMMTVLKASPTSLGTKAQVRRVLQAALSPGVEHDRAGPNSAHAQVIRDHQGRRVGVLTRSGAQWVCRFASEIDEEAVRHIVGQIPLLLATWHEQQ